MKVKIVTVILFILISGAIFAGGFHGSHPNFPNNGKDSPRFYGSPKEHPAHP